MTLMDNPNLILRRLENIDDFVIYTYLEGKLIEEPDFSFFTYSNEDYEEKFIKLRDKDNYREFEIFDAIRNKTLGIALILSIDFENRNAEIRIALKENLSTELIPTLLNLISRYSFDNLNLIKIYGWLPSKSNYVAVIEKLCIKEAVLPNSYFMNGELNDLHIYSILKELEC